jgi:hypothetical protein
VAVLSPGSSTTSLEKGGGKGAERKKRELKPRERLLMDPDDARRRLEEGGVMLCMDVPQGLPLHE